MVGVTTDNGSGTPPGETDLRGAINVANLWSGTATIRFDPTVFATSQTITLTQGQLELSNTAAVIAINGPGAGVTVSGDGASRVFQVDPGVTASISGLTISQGSAASGGGLYNQGTTHLTACTISDNSAAGNGGGLYSTGTITLTDCTLSGNAAAGGGGFASSGTAELYSCTISGNSATRGRRN